MSYESLLELLGFQEDPFLDSDADREDRLGEYFIPPPFFNAVLGSPAAPGSDIVFAPRGAGKTALKRMIEESPEHEQRRFLGVVYNEFDEGATRVADVTLERHIDNIIELILAALIDHVRENGEGSLSDGSRRILYWLVAAHLSTIQRERLRTVVGAIQLRSDAAKEWWNRITGPANTIITLLCAALGTTAPMMERFSKEAVNLGSGLDKLRSLQEIAREIGFESIYVLIDKVDESHLTNNDSRKAFELIQPMLQNLNLIQMRGFGFKFFLWNELLEDFMANCRADKITRHSIDWNQDQLITMFRKRITTFSDNRLSSINTIVAAPDELDVESLLVFFADGSPRQLIRLCREILKQQSEINDNATAISFDAVQRGILAFSQTLSLETIGQQILNELIQLHQVEYTVPFIAEVFEMEPQSARNKNLKWTGKGIAARTRRDRTGGTGAPSMVYELKSALIAISALAPISLDDFLARKVRVCRDCRTFSLADFDMRDDAVTCAVCRKEALVELRAG